MQKQIHIVRGDEYRAKIEEGINKGTFFEEVYRRSYTVIGEIVSDTMAYNRRCKNANGYKTRYQGLGNNIIIYTAERGQGKTSALQSVAEFLRDPAVGNEVLRDRKDIRFEVLDSIDPSAMDSGENIIRVLISRLFFAVDKTSGSEARGKNIDERAFRQDKQRLLELFQRCYNNIDSLKGKRGDETGDDLENLAQLGNSAKLKENLHDLILQFLKFRFGVEKEDNSFLVIPIDDADLAMGSVFDICEDIHNYLSVPNVIVMMAASYTQLSYAIYQKYLGQYNVLHSMQKKIPVDMKCYEMTMKYLEKVFPDGHRIELPRLEEFITESNGRIIVNYAVKDTGEGETCLLQGELRDLLRRQIYEKTGVLLEGRTKGYHVFFPRTLRELTHFLKLLCDMAEVNLSKAYQNIGEVKQCAEAREELEKIRENIRKLRQYFLNEWCGHLDAAQREVILNIDSLERALKLSGTVRILQEYLNASDDAFEVQEYTYHGILREVEENEALQKEPMLQEGIFLSFTLFLNEWFTAALSEREEETDGLHRFMDFLQTPVLIGNGSGQDPSGYKITGFTVRLTDVKENLQKEDLTEELREFFKVFCIPKGVDYGAEIIEKSDGGGLQWNPDIEKIRMDILWPVTYWLMAGGPERRIQRLSEKTEEKKDSIEDTASEVQGREVSLRFGIGVKTIATNYDVQRYLENNIERLIRKRKGRYSWITLCSLVYQCLDDWEKLLISSRKNTNETEKVLYPWSGEDVSVSGQWKDIITQNEEILCRLFLCEEGNRDLYIAEYYKTMQTVIEKIEKNIAELSRVLEESEDVHARQEIVTVSARMASQSMKVADFYPAIIGRASDAVSEEIRELESKTEDLMRIYVAIRVKADSYIKSCEETDSKEAFKKLMNEYGRELAKTRRNLRLMETKYQKEKAAGVRNGNASGT